MKLSRMEEQILTELEQGALPKVVATILKIERRTVENYKSRMRKKCFDAATFLKMMKRHGGLLGLRITVKVEEKSKRSV